MSKTYKQIKIQFLDGKPKFFAEDEWADYAYDGNFIIIKNNDGAWIAMYATSNVLSVELSQ